jgi:hypothetical protein
MTDGITNHNPEPEQAESGYQVRVKGCLSADFLAWLDLPGEANPDLDETSLWIATTDQAALYGSLNRLRDLGLTLIAIEPCVKNIFS